MLVGLPKQHIAISNSYMNKMFQGVIKLPQILRSIRLILRSSTKEKFQLVLEQFLIHVLDLFIEFLGILGLILMEVMLPDHLLNGLSSI